MRLPSRHPSRDGWRVDARITAMTPPRQPWRAAAAVAMVLLSTAACCSDRRDEWFTGLPPDISQSGDEWKPLPISAVHEVPSELLHYAIDRLEDARVVPVKAEDIPMLAGYNGVVDPDKRYFLVRALHGSRGTGYYRVRRHDDDLLVSHSSLGSCVVMNKGALLLTLDFTPRTVHVFMSVAK